MMIYPEDILTVCKNKYEIRKAAIAYVNTMKRVMDHKKERTDRLSMINGIWRAY